MPYTIGNYFIYIVTNPKRTVLYIGVTNDIERRIYEHVDDATDEKKSFAGKFNCYHLIYWERFSSPEEAIAREKQLKKWNRKKKETLIATQNPDWKFITFEE